jgi:NAD(P)-dependent dehydrogenase (short-subunit alcohol dehydrogenase family)
MKGLHGASVVVTGAARGIGLAVVQRLLAAGAAVHGLDVDLPDDSLAAAGASWHKIDVSDEDAVQALFRKSFDVGGLHGLVNCAGRVEDVSLTESSVWQWDEMIRHNVTTAFVMTREFADYAADYATIVNVGSVNASFGSARRVGYAVAKGAVETLTRVAACQLAGRGMRVNAVIPGAIATRMSPGPHAGDLCALGRRGTADEVASAIVFLVSDDASYITGTVLHVDGGTRLR